MCIVALFIIAKTWYKIMPFNCWISKLVYSYNGILLNNEKEQTSDIYINLGESQNIIIKEASFKHCTLYDYIHVVYTFENVHLSSGNL